jgi:hypothetical protein
MLLDSYTKIEQLINNIVLDNKKTKKIIELIKLYKIGNYIYPNILVTKCKISMQESYEIMKILIQYSFLKPVYALYCFKCQKFATEPYSNLNEIPIDVECPYENCDEVLTAANNTVAYFEVINRYGEDNE